MMCAQNTVGAFGFDEDLLAFYVLWPEHTHSEKPIRPRALLPVWCVLNIMPAVSHIERETTATLTRET